jgi:hypothetical protein
MFLPNLFGSPGSRMYRTGDLGRYLADGNIEFLGRLDQQVKIRGFRIEPEEVENAIMRCAGVSAAVVVAREDEPGDKRLVAYVVSVQEQPTPTVVQLRGQLQASLPEYMLPSAWVFVQALPLTPNGKIDRKALPAPEHSRSGLGTEYEAPRNATEELLANIWADVLKLDRVGIHDNFFALGGHSLLAIQAVNRIGKAFAGELAVRTLFEQATVATLAMHLDEQQRSPALHSAPPLKATPGWSAVAVLCAGAAVVPGPSGTRQHRLLHGSGGAVEGTTRRTGAANGVDGLGGSSRELAHSCGDRRRNRRPTHRSTGLCGTDAPGLRLLAARVRRQAA